jgi:LacI family transcriptional regulator
MVTVREVAQRAQVSPATVSRVLHNSPTVAPETRRRVLDVLESSGYLTNTTVRTLRRRRAGTVGLVVDDVTNPFYAQVIRAVSEELGRRQLRLVLWDSSISGEEAAVDAVDHGRVDAIIFTAATAESRLLRRALRRGTPLVLLNRVVPDAPCDQVDSDNFQQAHGVAALMAKAGHRHVAVVGGPLRASTANDRMAGFRAGCQAYRLGLARRHVVDGGFTYAGGRHAIERLLAVDGPRPTALFCVNDVSAAGALDELRRCGIDVPRQMWVVGYDDIPLTAWRAYDLTTVRQPLPEMARSAVGLALLRLEDPGAPYRRHRLPGVLVQRATTAVG